MSTSFAKLEHKLSCLFDRENNQPISGRVDRAGLPKPWPAKLFCVARKVFLRG